MFKFAFRQAPLFLTLLAAPLSIAWGASESPMAMSLAEADAPVGAEIMRAPDGLFYVNMKVNGQPVRFLVDTGANVMVLTASDAARVGATPEARKFSNRIATAGGSARMTWTRLDHVELAGREVHGLQAAIVEQGLPVSLLGQNMLSKLGSVTIEGDRLRMR